MLIAVIKIQRLKLLKMVATLMDNNPQLPKMGMTQQLATQAANNLQHQVLHNRPLTPLIQVKNSNLQILHSPRLRKITQLSSNHFQTQQSIQLYSNLSLHPQ